MESKLKENPQNFIQVCRNKFSDIDNAKGKENKIKKSIELFELFNSPDGKELLKTHPNFYFTFIHKLEELYIDVPGAFEKFICRYKPEVLSRNPVAYRTRSKYHLYHSACI